MSRSLPQQCACAALLVLIGCGSRSSLLEGVVEPAAEATGGTRPVAPGPSGPKPPQPSDMNPKPGDEPDLCVPACEGRACGADDGCRGRCDQGECPAGLHCSGGSCACDAMSCAGCCDAGRCRSGAEPEACGWGGSACVSCAGECLENACFLGPQSVTLFGGSDGWGSYTNATWVFDGKEWTEQQVLGPGPRSSGAMALLNEKNIIFGGIGEVDGSPSDGLGDTYEWDGETWTQRTVAGPSARWSHEMATLKGKVVLFGGYNRDDRYLAETWEWDGEAWTEHQGAGPPGRVAHAMATVGDQIVLFGGQGEQGRLGDTWVYDGDRWTELPVSPAPSARTGHGMASGAKRALLFGGGNNDETWEWDGQAWHQHPGSGPSARTSVGMAAIGSRVLLFGGLRVVGSGYQYLADTWEWDGSGWRELAVSGPPGLASPFMAER